MKKKIKINALMLLLAGILFILILCPLIMIFTKAVIYNNRLDWNHYFVTILEQRNWKTISNSLLLGVTVVFISTILAAPLAFLISKTKLAKHKWLDIVIMVPFMTPPFISSMGWILFVQKRGLLQQMFPTMTQGSEKFISFWGLALVMALHVFPFMVSMLKNAMLNINTNLEEAGAVFGGSFLYRMKRIVIPLLTGNYAIAALLVFTKTLSEYGTPYTFGTRIGFQVFTTDIHKSSTTSPIDFGKAASLSTVLISICLIIWMIQNNITRKRTYRTLSGKGVKVRRKKMSVPQNILAWLYIIILLIACIGIPYFSILTTSFVKLRGYGLVKGNFTIAHYIELFTSNDKAIQAMGTSLGLALLASCIAAVLGTVLSLAIRYAGGKRIKKIIESVSLLPEMLPSIVIVIGLMLFWNKFYTQIPLYNTLGMLIVAYVVLYLPYTVQYVNSAFSQIGENLIQAGRIFGGSRVYILRRITVPLLLRGIMTGWMMTFIISLRELVAASMVAPPGELTISTFIVREFEQGSVSVGMAMAVIYVFLTTGVLLILNYLTQKKEVYRV